MQALRLAAAAWLSFALASLLHVENAYWAAMPVWVITQPSRNLLLARAAYRIAGTLAGAALGLAILHLPLPVPAQLGFAALFIGVGAGLSHLLPGVRAYGAMMVAITTAVVVVPSALAPDASLHLALERIVCTLIGVLVTTLVMALWTPPTARQQFYQSVRGLAADALAMAARIISHPYGRTNGERRIMAEISELEARSTLVSATSQDARRRQYYVAGLIVAALEVMAAAYALAAQVRRAQTLPDGLSDYLTAMSEYLRHRPDSADSAPQACYQQSEATTTSPAISRLLAAVDDMTQAERALFTQDRHLHLPTHRMALLEVSRDWPSARQTALTAGSASLLATYAVHFLALPLAVPMAMAVCIFSIVLGSLPQPQQIAPKLFAGVCAGILMSIVYRLLVQPAAISVAALIFSIGPFILIGALARSHPRTAIPAIDANMCFLLASQAGHSAVSAQVVWSEALAMLLGTAVISGGFVLLPRLPHRRATQVARDIQHDLERLLISPMPWRAKANRQILRLMVHIGRASQLGEEVPRGLLAALNLGHAIAGLHQRTHAGDKSAVQALQALGTFATRPMAVADELLQMAEQIQPNSETSQLLEMAADALDYCKSLLKFAA